MYSYPLKWGEYLLFPFVVVLQRITKMLSSRVGGAQDAQRSITEGEFRTLLDIGVGEGEFEQDEAERLKGVFRFGDRQVRDVMTPRTEIVSSNGAPPSRSSSKPTPSTRIRGSRCTGTRRTTWSGCCP